MPVVTGRSNNPPDEGHVAPSAMRPWRVRVVSAVVLLVIVGHLHEVARQSEHWPFSNYPMWATVTREWDVTQAMPVGVSADDSTGEIVLTDPAYFAPMPIFHQRLALDRAARRQKDAVLRDYLSHYERRRRAGLHAGPELRGIRVYQLAWTMDRHASNAETPGQKRLLYEYPPPAAAPSATASSSPATAPADPRGAR